METYFHVNAGAEKLFSRGAQNIKMCLLLRSFCYTYFDIKKVSTSTLYICPNVHLTEKYLNVFSLTLILTLILTSSSISKLNP